MNPPEASRPTTRTFLGSFPGILLLHTAALPFILVVSWAVAAKLTELLWLVPGMPPGVVPVLVLMALCGAGLHHQLGRFTARSYGPWRTVRGHIARCTGGYIAALASSWVVATNRNAEGFEYVEIFFLFVIATAVGSLVGDLLLLGSRAPASRDGEADEHGVRPR